MKILQIIPSLNDGGAERFVVDLSNQLVKHESVEVVLVLFFNVDDKQFLLKELNKKIRLVQLNKKLGFDVKMFFRLYRLIKTEKPDIIHSHLRTIDYLLPSVLFTKAKYVHTIHNDAFKECPSVYKRFERNIFYKTNKYIPVTISKESSLSYIKAYHNNNFVEIVNGRSGIEKSPAFEKVRQEMTTYRVNPQTKVFVNLARISPQKNQLLLVSVFDKLIKEGLNVSLLIIGTKRDKEIVCKIEEVGSSHVFLLGTKTSPYDYLLHADAFCLTSFYEGMPISLIEAFQAGCVPVCTPSGGVQNMIENKYNGLLAKSVTANAFESTVREFLSLGDEEMKHMSDNCIDTYFMKYSIETTATNYMKVYNQ